MFRTLAVLLTVAAVLVAAAPTGNADSILTGGAEPGSQSAVSFASNYMQGYDFTANANTTLTRLGFWDSGSDGLAGTYQVGVWNTTTEVLLGSVYISNADALDGSLVISGGSYRYESLASAISLTSGETYTIAVQIGSAGLSAADSLFGGTPAAFTSSSLVTLGSSRRFESGASFAFPNGTTSSNWSGQVNATIGDAVPEPGTIALLGLGLLGVGIGARRRRRATV